MTIAILVVGTRGDVQPFLKLGQCLKKHGHRVRLATHDVYRDLVSDWGLEFYPLGGDPKKLSLYMCKSGGRLMPNPLNREELGSISEKMAMVREMLFATRAAVSERDPRAPPELPAFRADAIIANPVAYGHVHVAEWLDVPVHLMFPAPWTPTGDFPHPLSPLGSGCRQRDFQPTGLVGGLLRAQNWASYYGIDEFLYAGMRFMTNEFRESMDLQPIRSGEAGAHLIHDHRVPFAYQWSPLVLPRPVDYGPHVEVTGTIFSTEGSDYEPPEDLLAFINEADEAPIFVGFGSMIIDRPQELADMIASAARESGTRVLLQSSWTNLQVTSDASSGDEGPRLVYQLGNCPHDWLFRHVSAVVHHGGSGTTAAGLLTGRPTMICPFFGDQHLWAQVLCNVGVAVEPVPIDRLTSEALASAFKSLRGQGPEGAAMVARARELGERLAGEDGVLGAVDAFYRHLPLEGMVCDASLLLGPARDLRRARWYSPTLGLKLCDEAYAALLMGWTPSELAGHTFSEYRHKMNWRFAEPKNFAKGIQQGVATAITRYAQAGSEIIVEPVRGGYRGYVDHGLAGILLGTTQGVWQGVSKGLYHVVSGTRRLIQRPMQALGADTFIFSRRPIGSGASRNPVCHAHEGRLEPGECQRLLAAVDTVRAIRQAWGLLEPAAASASDRGGSRDTVPLPVHEPLPFSSVLELLAGLDVLPGVARDAALASLEAAFGTDNAQDAAVATTVVSSSEAAEVPAPGVEETEMRCATAVAMEGLGRRFVRGFRTLQGVKDQNYLGDFRALVRRISSRLRGEDSEALVAFEEVLFVLQPHLVPQGDTTPTSSLSPGADSAGEGVCAAERLDESPLLPGRQ